MKISASKVIGDYNFMHLGVSSELHFREIVLLNTLLLVGIRVNTIVVSEDVARLPWPMSSRGWNSTVPVYYLGRIRALRSSKAIDVCIQIAADSRFH